MVEPVPIKAALFEELNKILKNMEFLLIQQLEIEICITVSLG
jgi:hypothetical protein